MSSGPTAATPDNCRRKANRHRCYRLHGRTDKVEQVEKINFTIVFTGWMVGVGTILGMILDWGLIWLLGILWQDVRFLKLLRIVFFFRYNFRTEHRQTFFGSLYCPEKLNCPNWIFMHLHSHLIKTCRRLNFVMYIHAREYCWVFMTTLQLWIKNVQSEWTWQICLNMKPRRVLQYPGRR